MVEGKSSQETVDAEVKVAPTPPDNVEATSGIQEGIDMDEESKASNVSSSKSCSGLLSDQIDPYIKNPEYVRYKRRRSRSRSYDRNRSRSRSRERERRRKHRSRSRSRGRHRRSRSRSRARRHRRHSHSASRSRSRSASQSRRYKHKRGRKSRRSRSRSRSHERRREERGHNADAPRRDAEQHEDDDGNESKGEEEEAETKENAFKNDGSFLEMFKKMQEEKQKAEAEKNETVAAPAATTSEVKKLLPAFGKRRGGRVLKTGMVEKTKAVEDDELANATDPWSIYLKEVKRYKEACCDDDSKTRPLVK